MKKLVPLFLVVLLVAFTAPALAGDGDVQFFADKTIFLEEFFHYTETVTFRGDSLFQFNGEAWAKVQEQQENYNNFLSEEPFDAFFFSPFKEANIGPGSFNDGSGVANVNQSPGNLNNQANEVAISLGQAGTEVGSPAEAGTYRGLFCEAQVVTVQYNGILFHPPVDTTLGFREPAGNTYDTGGFTKSDTIDFSFAGFAGVVGVNQAAGSLNNQGNAVAIAGGIDQVVVKAATDVMLAQNNAYNVMNEGVGFGLGNVTSDAITNGSFDGATGVVGVNMAAGSLNNQKNAVAIAFSGPLP